MQVGQFHLGENVFKYVASRSASGQGNHEGAQSRTAGVQGGSKAPERKIVGKRSRPEMGGFFVLRAKWVTCFNVIERTGFWLAAEPPRAGLVVCNITGLTEWLVLYYNQHKRTEGREREWIRTVTMGGYVHPGRRWRKSTGGYHPYTRMK
ncbi:hypothetical protein J2S03_001363 [Alicyclobacillus cycloheptanicus]|uniref:Uncharacterized protein n=1 Tax=Alicyclobacillus cycloheptanicus TaxID=1457 RepID=A0ABT9XGU3_9BACL|nr:hypothetical protein [Alicyclobacillus cycloheptanicus]